MAQVKKGLVICRRYPFDYKLIPAYLAVCEANIRVHRLGEFLRGILLLFLPSPASVAHLGAMVGRGRAAARSWPLHRDHLEGEFSSLLLGLWAPWLRFPGLSGAPGGGGGEGGGGLSDIPLARGRMDTHTGWTVQLRTDVITVQTYGRNSTVHPTPYSPLLYGYRGGGY